MPNLSIKDVPETWAQALRQRAERNHRSLQGELMSLVEQAVLARPGNASPALPHSPVHGPDRQGLPSTRRGSKTMEQIYAEHLLRFPQPITQGPMSVDIIRQDRDSR